MVIGAKCQTNRLEIQELWKGKITVLAQGEKGGHAPPPPPVDRRVKKSRKSTELVYANT